MPENDSFVESPEITRENREIKNRDLGIEKDISRLIELKNETTPESAKEALSIIDNTVGSLFKKTMVESVSETDKLLQLAGKAKFETGPKIQIMGREGSWRVWIADDEQDPILQEKQAIIQKACDNGLRSRMDGVAGDLAVTEIAKINVEQKLLELAGAYNPYVLRKEKMDIFRSRKEDNDKRKKHALNWTKANETNINQLPEVVKINDLVSKAAKK